MAASRRPRCARARAAGGPSRITPFPNGPGEFSFQLRVYLSWDTLSTGHLTYCEQRCTCKPRTPRTHARAPTTLAPAPNG